MPKPRIAHLLLAILLASCSRQPPAPESSPQAAGSGPAESSPQAAGSRPAESSPQAAGSGPAESGARGEAARGEAAGGEVVVVAGGDVELGRAMGQKLLRDPGIDPLAPLGGWLGSAQVRFVNLEGPISEQHGETQSPRNSLIFTGPPAGAEALARAHIDLVSTANNHAWDYGRPALLETLVHLDRAGVRHVGTGADLAGAQAPVILERGGMKIAFLAATAVWNQEGRVQAEARRHVASADASWLVPAVRALKDQGVEAVIVSIHAGEEYQPAPLEGIRRLHAALIEAGADAIIGHHPHVLQGLGWQAGRPIFFSLGNLRMAMHSEHPETGLSVLARLRLRRGVAPRVEVCPLRQMGLEPRPLHRERDAAAQWALFASRWRTLGASTGAGQLGPPDEDGCAAVTPPVTPPTTSPPRPAASP